MSVLSIFKRLSRTVVRKSSARRRKLAKQLRLESLERRDLMAGDWVKLDNFSPAGSDTMVMLSDGSVLAHGASDTKQWWKYTPDMNGYYEHGTWSQLAPMHMERQNFAINVLPSGKVMVLGGEYSAGARVHTNTGEMYDPVNNSWTQIENFPEAQFGAGPTALLLNGKVLAGHFSSSRTYQYDPQTNSWTPSASLLHNDTSAGEGWVKMPGGNVVTYALSGSTPRTSQYYNSEADLWFEFGAPVETLAVDSGMPTFAAKLGPGVVLPDGNIFWAGATTHTAVYNTSLGVWRAGPEIPNGLGAFDAPGAVEVNGKVLFAAGPINVNMPGPTSMMEYDPISSSIAIVGTNSAATDFTPSPSQTDMLTLPSGQVLVTNGNGKFYLYNPDSAGKREWAPHIARIQSNGNSYLLSGTQLNGVTSGATNGNEGDMASNYPLIQFISSNGELFYGRTHDWSSVDIQTGQNIVTTQFDFPSNKPHGAYLTRVSASGMTSDPMLTVLTTQGTNTIALRRDPAIPGNYEILNNGQQLESFPSELFTQVEVVVDDAGATINIQDALPGVTINVRGRGDTQVRLGKNGKTDGIQGEVYLFDADGQLGVTVDDSADPIARDVSILAATTSDFGSVIGLSPAPIRFRISEMGTGALNVLGGSGNNSFVIAQTVGEFPINLKTGIGTDVVTAKQTSAQLTIDGVAGADIAQIGNGSMQSIKGPIDVRSQLGSVDVTVDDSREDNGSQVTMTDGWLRVGSSADVTWQSKDPTHGGVANLEFRLAGGTHAVEIQGTSNFGAGATTIKGNNSIYFVHVAATQGKLNLDGMAGTQIVTIGSPQAVSGIRGAVNVYNSVQGHTELTIDDRVRSTPSSARLLDGRLTGLAPADISWTMPSPLPPGFGLDNLKVLLGSAADQLNIESSGTVADLAVIPGDGTNTINVLGNSSHLYIQGGTGITQVIVGNGSMAGVQGAINLFSTNTPMSLVLNDSQNNQAQQLSIDGGSLRSQGGLKVEWNRAASAGSPGLGSLRVRSGTGPSTIDVLNTVPYGLTMLVLGQGTATKTVNVRGTTDLLNIDGGDAHADVNIESTDHTLSGIAGRIDIANSPAGSLNLSVNDTATASAKNISINKLKIDGLTVQPITFGSFFGSLNLRGGKGLNTWNVLDTLPTVVTTIFSAAATSSINVRGTTGPLGLSGLAGTQNVVIGSLAPAQGGNVQNVRGNVSVHNAGTGISNVVVDDLTDTVGRNITITNPLDQPNFTAISGLAPALIVTQTNPIGTATYGARVLRIRNGSGADTVLLERVGTGLAMNYNLGAGNDTITVTGAKGQITLDGGSGNDNFNIGTGQVDAIGAVTLVGGTGVDQVTVDDHTKPGNDSYNLGNAQLTRTTWTGRVTYSSMEGFKLTAERGNNLVTLPTAAAGVSYVVNGGEGSDTIDATALTVGVTLIGGNGNDVLKGGAGNDWLLGGLGNDLLEGNGGRDILSGGSGADKLFGGQDDDLLLGASIQYYNENTGGVNKPALDLVMREWSSTHSYATRIANLMGTGTTGLNGTSRVNASTVVRDTAIDELTGDLGDDWFVSDSIDKLKDRLAARETVTTIA